MEVNGKSYKITEKITVKDYLDEKGASASSPLTGFLQPIILKN